MKQQKLEKNPFKNKIRHFWYCLEKCLQWHSKSHYLHFKERQRKCISYMIKVVWCLNVSVLLFLTIITLYFFLTDSCQVKTFASDELQQLSSCQRMKYVSLSVSYLRCVLKTQICVCAVFLLKEGVKLSCTNQLLRRHETVQKSFILSSVFSDMRWYHLTTNIIIYSIKLNCYRYENLQLIYTDDEH